MKSVQCAGLLIDVIETCDHFRSLDVACEKCDAQVAKLEPGVTEITETSRYYNAYQKDRTYVVATVVDGRVIPEGQRDRFVVCPHGERIPLGREWGGYLNVVLPRATKYKTWCAVCEAQRVAGREQDERVKALLKELPKPSKAAPRLKLRQAA